MKKIKVLNNQSLFDIALQEYGTVEAVFDLAMANELSITDELNAGQVLLVPESENHNPEIVEYYRKNNVKPASGDFHPQVTDFTATKFDEMKILFEWGASGNNHPGITQNITYGGNDITKHLLKMRLSDDTFLSKVQDPILLIDRRREKRNKGNNITRLAGWKHPHPNDWDGRVFEIPLTQNPQILDFGQERFFKTNNNFPIPTGNSGNINFNYNVGWVDLAFRIRYRYYGVEKTTPHLGRIRMQAIKDDFLNIKVISYAYK